MARSSSIEIGDVAEVAWMFRDGAGSPVSPTSVTVEALADGADPDTPTESWTAADSEVTIGVTISTALADAMGITAAENTDGTGIVQLLYTPATSGWWQYHCAGTGAITGAGHVWGEVRPQFYGT